MPDKNPDPSPDAQCESSSCPVAKTAALIDGKWTTRIIRDLLPGKKRYSELQRSLNGISPKVLADRLRFLEHQGLITKTVYPVVPPHTEYERICRVSADKLNLWQARPLVFKLDGFVLPMHKIDWQKTFRFLPLSSSVLCESCA